MTDAFEPKSDFLRVMQERGFIHQCSDFAGLDDKARSGALVGYIGFDCTAPSLHVGTLVPIMMLHWLQATGGKPIALMGGGTTMVGDPSGKDESRKLLTVERSKPTRRESARPSRISSPSARQHDAIMPDNAEWLAKLNYIDFLRDVGRHFSVNRMLAMDSVKLRLEREQELSFLEFNYMCLQAYDFVELNRRCGVRCRWAAPTSGAISSPASISAGGWARAALRSDLAADHHRVRREDGQDGGRRGLARRDHALALRLLAVLAQRRGRRRRPLPQTVYASAAGRDRRLESLRARRSTRRRRRWPPRRPRCCTARAAEAAAETARRTFEEGELAESLPTIDVPGAEFEAGLGALTAFVRAGLVASTGEARRQIRGGGLRVNDATLTDERTIFGRDALSAAGVVKLSLGRKKHVLLRAV